MSQAQAARDSAVHALRCIYHRFMWRVESVLDMTAQVLVWMLKKHTRITGAGVFWYPDHPIFWDAWTEPSNLPSGGGSSTLRAGRMEFIVDWRGRRHA